MNEIEYAKKRYYELKERRDSLLRCIADDYDFDGDMEDEDGVEQFLEEIHSGEIILFGNDDRDLMYIEDMMLAFELAATVNDDYRRRCAVDTALKFKKQRAEDIKKAEEVISVMDEVINICDKKQLE